ncbi:MAG TPA: hypothetical protein VIH99_05660 [Bdellovibrionota bacterium]|jgi:uncharacterized lipoprotein YehR (DUF1307 family)
MKSTPKKLSILALALVTVIALNGCGNKKKKKKNDDASIKVVHFYA